MKRPEGTDEGPPDDRVVAAACARAWKVLEVALLGPVLGRRLARTTDQTVREQVGAFLAVFGDGDAELRLAALTELRAARDLDGALDGELTAYPALAAVLEATPIVTTFVRELLRLAAPTSRWLWPAAPAAEARAVAAIAAVLDTPARAEELERLLTMAPYVDENVQFTVYRPRALAPGTWQPLLAFAHLAERRPGGDDEPDPIAEVQRQAAHALGASARDYQDVTQDSRQPVPVEGELTFVPEIAGVEFNPPRRSFVWLEPVHREEFRMRADARLDGQTARGRLSVYLGHILIAEVSLGIRVDRNHVPTAATAPAEQARPYRKIFASYSHRDLAMVAQFERYGRTLGDEYVRDWMHLRTGEVWAPRLQQLIEQADVFQLFWSTNSMRSPFVRQEWEHALSLDRPSFVRPTYWEDPLPRDAAAGLPPEVLLRLHFQKLGAFAPAEPPAPPAEPAELEEAEPVAASMDHERPMAPMARPAPVVAPAQAPMASPPPPGIALPKTMMLAEPPPWPSPTPSPSASPEKPERAKLKRAEALAEPASRTPRRNASAAGCPPSPPTTGTPCPASGRHR